MPHIISSYDPSNEKLQTGRLKTADGLRFLGYPYVNAQASLCATASNRSLRRRRPALKFQQARRDAIGPIVHRVFSIAPLPLRSRAQRYADRTLIDSAREEFAGRAIHRFHLGLG